MKIWIKNSLEGKEDLFTVRLIKSTWGRGSGSIKIKQTA